MTEQEREGFVQRLSKAAALVKLACGTANNAAWLVVLDGVDHAKRCKRYGFRVRQAFNQAIQEWHLYEAGLKYAKFNRMFRLSDMSEEIRRKYGDITDAEYYNFWASIGGPAYMKTKPLITSLWNKHRLSLESHKVKDAEHVAWVLTASVSIKLALDIHSHALQECVNMNIPVRLVHDVFDQFSIARLDKAWCKAMNMLAPDAVYDLDVLESRNIQMGMEQLRDAWLDPTLLYKSTMQSVEDYEEIFATRGFQKKVMREIADVEQATIQELNNNR